MAAYQGSSELMIHAGPERVYKILEDSTLLPQWASMVKHTTGKTERAGSVRECQVEWEGRQDQVAERCVEAVPNRRIAWVMEKGMMTRMFSSIRFGFDLEPQGDDATLLRLGFHYEPRHILARLMWHLMMKKKLEALQQGLLGNLKRFAEARQAEAR